MKISAVIITKNEELNIKRCLQSLKQFDEIVVVDSGSSDNTVTIAESFGCRVYKSEWLGFGRTKQLAVDYAKNDWVFSIDADETLSDELNKYISEFEDNGQSYGFRFKRDTFYLGKKIRYSGWQNDFPLRLFNRKYGRFNHKVVHESIKVDGKIEKVMEPINHYSFPDLETHLEKMIRYAELTARQKMEKGEKIAFGLIPVKALSKFIKMYILQLGFLDGKYGLILALNSSYGVYLKYSKLWLIQK